MKKRWWVWKRLGRVPVVSLQPQFGFDYGQERDEIG